MRRLSRQLGQRDPQEALPGTYRSWSVKSNGELLLEMGAGSWEDVGSMGKRLTLLWLTSLKGNKCGVMFGKTEVGSLDVTVVARLKDKHICIEWERTGVG